MNELLFTALVTLGLALSLVAWVWSLFGTFRTARCVGWLFVFVPLMGATAWAILDWEEARLPIALQLFSGGLLMALGVV